MLTESFSTKNSKWWLNVTSNVSQLFLAGLFNDSTCCPLTSFILFHFQKVICGLNNKIYEDTKKEQKVEQVSQYMEARIKRTRDHNSWARKFFFCECLNFFNVILQIILTDKFLGGEFSTYGTEVIHMSFKKLSVAKWWWLHFYEISWQHLHYLKIVA